MAKMTPRKFTKLPWIREATGSRCEEIARKLREDQIWEVAKSVKSEPGEIIAVIDKTAGSEVSLERETVSVSARGVTMRERQQICEGIVHGQLAHVPREDGNAYIARVALISRQYGRRKEVIRRVQAEIKRRDGVVMSAQWIEACWDEFRDFESRLRAEKD